MKACEALAVEPIQYGFFFNFEFLYSGHLLCYEYDQNQLFENFKPRRNQCLKYLTTVSG